MHITYISRYDIVMNMGTDRYTFRLPKATLEYLDELQEKGIIKNRTEGVIKGVEMLYEMEAYNKQKGAFQDIVATIIRNTQLMDDWPDFPMGTKIPFYGNSASKIMITKLGPEEAEIIRDADNQRVVINVKKDEIKTK